MKVKATATGYFGHMRRRDGDVFSIPDEPRRKVRTKDEVSADGHRRYRADSPEVIALADKNGTIPAAFSGKWMVPVSDRAPERTTSAPEALRKHHDSVLADRANVAGVGKATGEQEVI